MPSRWQRSHKLNQDAACSLLPQTCLHQWNWVPHTCKSAPAETAAMPVAHRPRSRLRRATRPISAALRRRRVSWVDRLAWNGARKMSIPAKLSLNKSIPPPTADPTWITGKKPHSFPSGASVMSGEPDLGAAQSGPPRLVSHLERVDELCQLALVVSSFVLVDDALLGQAV